MKIFTPINSYFIRNLRYISHVSIPIQCVSTCNVQIPSSTFRQNQKPYRDSPFPIITNYHLNKINNQICRYLVSDNSVSNANKQKEIPLEKHGLKDVKLQTDVIKTSRRKILLKDLKETKNKVKERVEEIIEKENIYTIPNALCVSRVLLSPYLGILIVQANFNFALVILSIAAITDLLDGWIARTWKSQSSKIGSFLDPMADKVLIAVLFLSLTYQGLIPIVLTAMIIARDALLVTAGFVIRYRSLPPPRTLSRYFDMTHATAQLAPTTISKINTAVQLLLVGSTLAAPVFHYVGHPLMECLWYITGVTTICSGASYLISKNTYQYFSDNNNDEKKF